jgi:hypothetical protein
MVGRFGRHVRQQLVGYVALFVALGGVSYAAVSLPRNSVGSAQIRNGQVKNADLARNSVSSAKVKNGSLLASDFKVGQLPGGPPGPQGPRGADGAPGAPGAPGAAAASMLMGRTSAALNSAGAVEYLAPSGTSVPAAFATVSMLSPAQPTIARDFAIKLSAAVLSPWSRNFEFRIDGASTGFGCTVQPNATTCTSEQATLLIPAGKSVAIQTSGPGVPGAALAEFGWRATTP